MAEYIEREALLRVLRGDAIAKYPASFSFGLFAAADEVSKLKAADVVPVVRCKDCNYLEDIEGQYPYCSCHNHECAYNNFCSYGERKDGE